jgi:hypothetical protein
MIRLRPGDLLGFNQSTIKKAHPPAHNEATFITSAEPDYSDEEVHLGSESLVGPTTMFRYLL